jgi:UDP-glucose 4-epimerase
METIYISYKSVCRIASRAGDPKWLVAANRKVKNLLNWEPKICLDKGIQKTIAIYRL